MTFYDIVDAVLPDFHYRINALWLVAGALVIVGAWWWWRE